MDPFLMGRARKDPVSWGKDFQKASRQRLDGFDKRIIEGDLPKEIDDAKLKAAAVAHSIMHSYTLTPKLSFKSERTEKVDEILRETLLYEKNFWKTCNGFLKDFDSETFRYYGDAVLVEIVRR
jgi:hypothetical protein